MRKQDTRDLRKDKKEMIRRYQLGEMIGKGGIGRVFKCLDIDSGQTVAVKQVGLKHLKRGRLDQL